MQACQKPKMEMYLKKQGKMSKLKKNLQEIYHIDQWRSSNAVSNLNQKEEEEKRKVDDAGPGMYFYFFF